MAGTSGQGVQTLDELQERDVSIVVPVQYCYDTLNQWVVCQLYKRTKEKGLRYAFVMTEQEHKPKTNHYKTPRYHPILRATQLSQIERAPILFSASKSQKQIQSCPCQNSAHTWNVEELLWLEGTTLILVNLGEVLVQLLELLLRDYNNI